MKYYLLNLNNNICAFKNNKPYGDIYDCARCFFNNDIKRDFKIPSQNKEEKSIFKKNITTYQKIPYINILGVEKDNKIYDIITQKEIKFAKEKEARGKKNTYYDYLTYSYKRELPEEKIAETLNIFLLNEENVYIYKDCIYKVEEYNHKCYINTVNIKIDEEKIKEEKIIRNRKIIDEFQRKYLK